MLVTGFPAAAFGTNCWVIAPAAGEECLVVDPGVEVVPRLMQTLAEHRLRPAAVLLTHGHLDHTYSVTPVTASAGVAARIHSADRYRLKDPIADLGPGLAEALQAQFGALPTWEEPNDVVEVRDRERLTIAGIDFEVIHAPGHTEGSVMFQLDAGQHGQEVPLCLSGDVLFAGSIGRSDLPGGDPAVMNASLRDKVLPLPDETEVLPGHGPVTTIGRERATNPYLLQLQGGR